MYDMNGDPFQTRNLAVDIDDALNDKDSDLPLKGSTNSAPEYDDPAFLARLQARLGTLLMVLKTCKGKTCSDPWSVLHTDGSVKSLKDAMDTAYDCFYKMQKRIEFTGCAHGYIRELEGPGQDQGDVFPWKDGMQAMTYNC